LQERARLAFFDVRKLLDATGAPKAIQDLDDDTAAAIAGLDVVNIGSDDKRVGEVLKIKLADKNASLTALEKHLGLYKDADSGDGVHEIHIHLN
jgi:phage terminase small subunit